jgi:hypothetical protein
MGWCSGGPAFGLGCSNEPSICSEHLNELLIENSLKCKEEEKVSYDRWIARLKKEAVNKIADAICESKKIKLENVKSDVGAEIYKIAIKTAKEVFK